MKKRSDLNNNYGISSEAVKYAAEQGYDVQFPKDNELFIDIDDQNGYDQFMRAFGMLEQLFPGTRIVRDDPSKSNMTWENGDFLSCRRHIVVALPESEGLEFNPIMRVALQSILGSDCKRELLTIKNLRAGDLTPTLFFEVKK